MSPARELWKVVRDALLGAGILSLVTDVYDKVPPSPWGRKNAYISRGPSYWNDDGADCIDGLEITLQIDVWSKINNSWAVDEVVEAVRKALHEQELPFVDNALVELRVELCRITDDPNPLVTHGTVQVVALVEIPGVS